MGCFVACASSALDSCISWQCLVSQCHPNVRARVKLSLLLIGAAQGFVLHQRAWKRLNLIPRNHQFSWLHMVTEGSAWALYIGRSDVCKRLEPSFQGAKFGVVPVLQGQCFITFMIVWRMDILLTHVFRLDYADSVCHTVGHYQLAVSPSDAGQVHQRLCDSLTGLNATKCNPNMIIDTFMNFINIICRLFVFDTVTWLQRVSLKNVCVCVSVDACVQTCVQNAHTIDRMVLILF